MKNIFLIAGLGERYYFEPFLEACADRELSIHICDPSRYPLEATMSIFQDRIGCVDGCIDTIQIVNGKVEASSLVLSSIQTAWYLRENSPPPSVSDTTVDTETRFRSNETRQALRAMFSTLRCKWVNKKENVELVNSNKLYQQSVAAQCGLGIPITAISNDPRSICNFAPTHSELLLKSMGYVWFDKEGKYFLYSERFSREELSESSEAIHSCPVFAQEYVEKKCEHRVMVIGQRVLSCKIDSQSSDATKTDWRHYDLEKVAHTESVLPSSLQDALLLFMEKVGLRYGAIDLIETPDDNYVFLEVNPSGQWGWVADMAGLPIPTAVADMLENV